MYTHSIAVNTKHLYNICAMLDYYNNDKYDLNQLNAVRYGLGMLKAIRNDVSYIKFEQTVQKLYKQDMCGVHLRFSLFVHFCKIFPRFCSRIYVEVISTSQHFTARHVPQTILATGVHIFQIYIKMCEIILFPKYITILYSSSIKAYCHLI